LLRSSQIDYFADLVTELVDVCCKLLIVEDGVEEDGDFEEEVRLDEQRSDEL